MHVVHARDVSVAVVPDKDDVACCTVTLPDGVSSPILRGKLLEACVATAHGYALFLSDDCLYDERLHIYWLDRQGAMRDWATLGAWDTPAFCSKVTLMPPHRVQFGFFHNDVWEVVIHDTPQRWRVPRGPDARWVRRPWFRRRWIDVRCVQEG